MKIKFCHGISSLIVCGVAENAFWRWWLSKSVFFLRFEDDSVWESRNIHFMWLLRFINQANKICQHCFGWKFKAEISQKFPGEASEDFKNLVASHFSIPKAVSEYLCSTVIIFLAYQRFRSGLRSNKARRISFHLISPATLPPNINNHVSPSFHSFTSRTYFRHKEFMTQNNKNILSAKTFHINTRTGGGKMGKTNKGIPYDNLKVLLWLHLV